MVCSPTEMTWALSSQFPWKWGKRHLKVMEKIKINQDSATGLVRAPGFGLEVIGRLEKVLIILLEKEKPGRKVGLRVQNNKISFL